MSLRFAVVHEARADFETATELANRVLLDALDDWQDGAGLRPLPPEPRPDRLQG